MSRGSGLLSKAMFAALLSVVLAAFGATPTPAATVKTGHLELELVADGAAVPGKAVTVALRQQIAPGWHTYWRNPGDAGEATEITWTLPNGWTAGPILWPAPGRAMTGPLMNYVFSDKVLLPTTIRVPSNASPDTKVTLSAHASLLVCKDVCVPEEANLSLTLPVSASAARDPSWGAEIAKVLAATPRALSGEAKFAVNNGQVTLALSSPSLSHAKLSEVYFYPYSGSVLDHAKAQTATLSGDRLTLALPGGFDITHNKVPQTLSGVLVIGGGKAFEVNASPGKVAASVAAVATPAASPAVAPPAEPVTAPSASPAPAPTAATPAAPEKDLGLPAAVALAFLGGLILNLMPCVFPVLSIKAAALARHTEHPAAARAEGVAYLVGVVLTFVGLAAALIAARHAGEAVGWGFQLQSPATVAVLTLIMLASALNLSGLFEFGLSAQNAGSGLAAQSGLTGAFFTGVLAVVVAAPCTGPFMASTIGWALAQSEATALAVFAALGIGLASPFVALAFAPGLYRMMPKPGAWMEGLRKTLAFPMYGAAAWLAWVFAMEAGANAVPGLYAAALVLAFGAWLWGVSQRAQSGNLQLGARIGAVISILLAVLALNLGPKPAPAASADAAPTASGAVPVEVWSPAHVAELQAAGRNVFVDFTAAWCVTCKVNEAGALASPKVIAAFAKTKTAYLRADWTNRNAEIANALKAQGRAGVPLYLVYARKGGAPAVLPQLLTEKDVLQALDAAAR